MKKLFNIVATFLLVLLLVSCNNANDKNITVIATTTPHAEILEVVRGQLQEAGYTLTITTISDYYFPNPAVAAGDADANFFQHVPFLNAYNEDNPDKQLVIGSYVHIEPIGIYSNAYTSLDDIQDGDTVLISNSVSDHGRILKLFSDAGLITLADDFDITSNTIDLSKAIVSNPKHLIFKADVSPDFLFAAYKSDEADLYVINSNYVLEGGGNPATDSIFIESTMDNPYVNILALREADINLPKIQALITALESEEVDNFINETYHGSVIPA